ncbi:hypothetical protein JCM5353_002173 [Sporobolomyces roseus]
MTEYDTYLTLSFPSLSAFLSSTSHLSIVSSTSTCSSSLLILIRTSSSSPTTPTPWSSPPDSTSSSSSSAPSSSSSPLPPTHLWNPLESSLANIYSTAATQFLRQNKPLSLVDVVLDQLRQLPFCIPSNSRSINWIYSAQDDEPEIVGKKLRDRGSYEVVAMGGTFDHLHAGHKILLSMACSIATKKLIVGVSDDALLGKKQFREYLESIEERIGNVEKFIELVRPTIRHQVVPLQDVYGPTATDPDIQALVVSLETASGGSAINKLRQERELSILDTYTINLVADDGTVESESEGEVRVETKMGSTGIREWICRQQEGRRENGEALNGDRGKERLES